MVDLSLSFLGILYTFLCTLSSSSSITLSVHTYEVECGGGLSIEEIALSTSLPHCLQCCHPPYLQKTKKKPTTRRDRPTDRYPSSSSSSSHPTRVFPRAAPRPTRASDRPRVRPTARKITFFFFSFLLFVSTHAYTSPPSRESCSARMRASKNQISDTASRSMTSA